MDQKKTTTIEQQPKRTKVQPSWISKEERDEFKAIMRSESSHGISVYDYYYLDQDDI